MNKFYFLLRYIKNRWHSFLAKKARRSASKAVSAAIYNEAVKPLMDIDALNERIGKIKILAKSNAVSSGGAKFFIISRGHANSGLFSYVLTSFSHLIYALAEEMIPIIDMQNFRNTYLEKGKRGQENSWEYFFKQPCGYSLGNTGNGECIYSAPDFWQGMLPLFVYDDRLFESKNFQLWAAIFRNFFQLSDSAAQYIDEEYNRIIKPDMRVIGVYCRGTDFKKMRPADHFIQPEADDVIYKVKSVMREWDCDYVYVCSEERKTVERFENAFPGRVLAVSRMYYDDIDFDYGRKFISRARFNRDNDAYLRGLEYLSSVMVFSRCNSAILGICGGSMAAMYINGGKFENTYIFNLGRYT